MRHRVARMIMLAGMGIALCACESLEERIQRQANECLASASRIGEGVHYLNCSGDFVARTALAAFKKAHPELGIVSFYLRSGELTVLTTAR